MRTMEMELDSIKRKLLELSTRVEEVVQKAIIAVENRNEDLARQALTADNPIDEAEVDIEEACLDVLATQQPVATDLRFLVGVLKVNNDLERIADLAVNIAERALFLSHMDPVECPFDYRDMAMKTRRMLKDCLDALIRRDVVLAKKVCAADEEVDAINREMYRALYKAIKADPERVETYLQYLSVSRHLERIADYATNIAEDVVYMVKGEIVRHKPEEVRV
jgi:phosphate transport system protein